MEPAVGANLGTPSVTNTDGCFNHAAGLHQPRVAAVCIGRVVQVVAWSTCAAGFRHVVVTSVTVGGVSSSLTLLVISLVIVSLIILPFTPVIDISILPILVAHHRLVEAALQSSLLLRWAVLRVATSVTLSCAHVLISIVASATIISRVLAIAPLVWLTLMHVMIGAYVRTAMSASMIVASVPTAGVLLHRLVHHLRLLSLATSMLFGIIIFAALIRVIP